MPNDITIQARDIAERARYQVADGENFVLTPEEAELVARVLDEWARQSWEIGADRG